MTDTRSITRLPKGWAWAKLGEVCKDPQYGWTTSAVAEGELHLLRTTDITSGNIDWRSVPYCKEEPIDAEKYLLEDGDVVISRAGSVGFSHLIRTPEPSIFASYLIRFKPLIDERYLAYFLKSPLYWQAISERKIGIALANVNASKLRQIPMPIAPLGEQTRIVGRVEEFFARLDAGVEGLRKVKAQLKRYRQAVLKYAFEGKLTEEWRKTHKHETEPATKLLERIKQEREKDPKHKEPALIDKFELPEIQENWIWTTIGSLFDVCSGGTPSRRKPEYWKGNIPWVSSGEVAFCEIKDTNECITKEGLENSSARLYHAGTVLMALYGEGKTRGQAAILRITATTNQAVACILCANSPVPPEYVYWWLHYRYYETRRIREGANQPNMYLHHVRKMAIPVAPLSEQEEIIQKIEESLSVADEIHRTVDSSLSKAERLRQCMLKTAFEGGLVSQDPSDEPAERLLERIKVERTKSKGEKDTSRRKKKNKPKQLELSSYVE
ncbi:restriction endonuclease subunit S [Candidatus Bathyarchaeota archaeon]|nr:restriction endonuclease subunit S [Candidatus Bathyarchaeota archaeon]